MKLNQETFEYVRDNTLDSLHLLKDVPEARSVLIYLRKALIELDVFEDRMMPVSGTECTICRAIVPDGQPRHTHPCE